MERRRTKTRMNERRTKRRRHDAKQTVEKRENRGRGGRGKSERECGTVKQLTENKGIRRGQKWSYRGRKE